MLIALKLKAAALGAAVVAPMLAAALTPAPQTAVDGAVTLPVSSFSYRLAGDFSRDGRSVAAPVHEIRHDGGLAMMKAQVTAAEYARCMEQGACPKVALPPGTGNVAMVGCRGTTPPPMPTG